MRLFVISVILSITTFANAFIINNEANAKIQQTHHLAVIKLSEDRADVAVYINFTGIPAGKKVTYILPFMYKPENFKIAESSSMGFYADYIQDVDKQIDIQNDITNRNGSKILQNAWSLPLSIPIMTKREFWLKDEEEFVNPYQNEKSADIKANLDEIVTGDLNKLIQQDNVVNYRMTPYYAKITLTGVANKEKTGRGVVITFTHHNLTNSQYEYPLWISDMAKIPILTDIYMTCNKKLTLSFFTHLNCKKVAYNQLAKVATNYFTNGSLKSDEEIASEYYSRNFSVFHIACFKAKPDQNISATIFNKKLSWRYQFATDMTNRSYAAFILLLVAIFSWMVTIPFLIKPHCNKYPEKSIWKEFFIPYLIILAYLVPINAVIITTMAEPFYGFMLAIVFTVARCSSIFTGDNPAPPVAKLILQRFDLPFPWEEKILAGKCWLLSTGLFIWITQMLYLAAR
ncbi:MAG: hypothetical protein WCO98_07400 [bacterium]